jgi:hypothetical protein
MSTPEQSTGQIYKLQTVKVCDHQRWHRRDPGVVDLAEGWGRQAGCGCVAPAAAVGRGGQGEVMLVLKRQELQ